MIYYNKNKGCSIPINTIIAFISMVVLMTICHRVKAQSWKYENRGLYPQSIQATVNVYNTAVGIKYGYLFQDPILNMPLGIYGSFSNTISPNLHYCNYFWERKYSIGMSITLPHELGNGLSHMMGTIGLIYNDHPISYRDAGLRPGQNNPNYYHTTKWGCDLGIQYQYNHFNLNLMADIINWMKYIQISIGYAFSYY